MRTKRVNRVGPMGMALASLIFSQLPVDGQSRRSGSRERPTAGTQRSELPPVSRVEDSRPNSKPVMLTSSPKSQKMAAPFRSGKLPEPLRKPPGTPDEVAATLAKQVAAGDDQARASVTGPAFARSTAQNHLIEFLRLADQLHALSELPSHNFDSARLKLRLLIEDQSPHQWRLC
ncbi:hypothetical protein BH20ACI3_BH20ACI3_38290 [soil metagenome]